MNPRSSKIGNPIRLAAKTAVLESPNIAVVVPPVVMVTVTEAPWVVPVAATVDGLNEHPMPRATGATLDVSVGPLTDTHSIEDSLTFAGSVKLTGTVLPVVTPDTTVSGPANDLTSTGTAAVIRVRPVAESTPVIDTV